MLEAVLLALTPLVVAGAALREHRLGMQDKVAAVGAMGVLT